MVLWLELSLFLSIEQSPVSCRYRQRGVEIVDALEAARGGDCTGLTSWPLQCTRKPRYVEFPPASHPHPLTAKVSAQCGNPAPSRWTWRFDSARNAYAQVIDIPQLASRGILLKKAQARGCYLNLDLSSSFDFAAFTCGLLCVSKVGPVHDVLRTTPQIDSSSTPHFSVCLAPPIRLSRFSACSMHIAVLHIDNDNQRLWQETIVNPTAVSGPGFVACSISVQRVRGW
jgi:hypothetical protein